MSNPTENKDTVRRFMEALNDHDLDGVTSLVAPDLVNHAAIPEAQGAKGLRTIFQKLFDAMPDLRSTCEDVIAEGDRVVCRVTVRGTQSGPLAFARLPLAASGRTCVVEHIHVMRFAAGKIVEHWAQRDDLGMLRQLGHSAPGGAS